MSKLNYPEDGIIPTVRDTFSDCSSSLESAVSQCSYDVPSDFDYRHYLHQLEDRIKAFRRELDEIRNSIESTDRRFSATAERAANNIRNCEIKPQIKPRSTII